MESFSGKEITRQNDRTSSEYHHLRLLKITGLSHPGKVLDFFLAWKVLESVWILFIRSWKMFGKFYRDKVVQNFYNNW